MFTAGRGDVKGTWAFSIFFSSSLNITLENECVTFGVANDKTDSSGAFEIPYRAPHLRCKTVLPAL